MLKSQPTKLANTINWDYRIDKKYLNDPEVERWMLERQLNYGGDVKIKVQTLLKYWPDVRIEDTLWRALIERFLETTYAKERSKK